MNTQFVKANSQPCERTLLRNVYLWMTLGLSLSGTVAWWATNSKAIRTLLFGNAFTSLILFAAALIIVFNLSRNIMNMSVSKAVGSFILYAIINGLMLSFIFMVYTRQVIYQAFGICAAMFAVTSLWAAITGKDLSGWGHYLGMGLIGLIIAGLFGLFFGGESFNFLYSIAGVILFTALTAYDTQGIKKMSEEIGREVEESVFLRLSILGALKLYLDFINMFLFLLRILGRRR